MMPLRGWHLPRIEFLDEGRRLRARIGPFEINQSTLLLSAALLVGVGGAYGAVLFRWLIRVESAFALGWIARLAEGVIGRAGIIVPLLIGGAFVAWLVKRFAPEARGHGVPEVMAAVALQGGIMRPRVIAVKSLASATSIGFGGSCGREGPIVQIGAAIGSVIGQFLKAPASFTRTLVACGAAAGISTTFNAPIGGVFFASEVILGDFAPRSFAAIVVSSVTAAVIGRAYLGNRPSFDAAAFALVSSKELWLYALLGVSCALWAAGFVRLLYFLEDRFDASRVHPVIRAALGFGMVGTIAIWFPQVVGVGYEHIQQVFNEHVPALHALTLSILKPLATSLTLGSGGSGGIFAPSLFTGAMLGDAFGTTVHTMFPSWTGPAAAYGLVAMAGVFSAAAEAPITSIVIIFEMSNNYTIVLPLMICSVIATVVGRRLVGGTVYELKLIRRGINWARARNPRLLGRVKVSSVQRQPPIIAHDSEDVEKLASRLGNSGELVVPVVHDGQFIGIVTAADIARKLSTGGGERKVGELVQRHDTRLRPSDTLDHAADLMANPNLPLLPVVDDLSERMVAIVTRRDVLEAYRSAVDADRFERSAGRTD
jgi:chloride channel protein, CIC family